MREMGAWQKGRYLAAWRWTTAQVVLALLAFAALPGSAGAAAPILESPAGALDPSFASGGVLTAPFGTGMGPEEGRDAAIQSDGKIVVLIRGLGGDYLTRYLPNGELDTAFGSDGIVAGSSSQRSFSYLTVDAQDRIVVISTEPAPNWESPDKSFTVPDRTYGVVYRYLPDGSPDTSFGTDGKTTIIVSPPEGLTPGSAAALPLAVLTASDGSIMVGGSVGSICGWEIINGESQWWEESGTFVARLNPDGSLESQFGSSGVVSTHGNCGKYTLAESFGGLVQPSPEVVLALSNHPEDDTWRFRNYSSTGVLSETSTSVESENAVEITMVDGRYIVLSENHAQSGLLFSSEALRQFTPKETVDPTFGTNGRVAIPSMACEFGPGCLAVLPNEHIEVAGRLYRGLVGVRRYLANGSEDDSFGTNGSAWVELTHEGEMNTVNKLLILHGQPLVIGAENVSGKPYADNETALTLFQADGGLASNPSPPNPAEGPASPIPSAGSSGAGSAPDAGSEGMTGSSVGTAPSPVSGGGTDTQIARPTVAVKPLTEPQKLAKALKMCRKDATKSKQKTCEAQARKRYKPKPKRKAKAK